MNNNNNNNRSTASFSVSKYILSSFLLFFTFNLFAAPAVVDTTISVFQDGVGPFDATTYVAPTTDPGTDADSSNGVVKVGDLIVYKVEVSLNDAEDTNLTAEVTVNDKVIFEKIPNVCTGLSSAIINNGLTLICNLDEQIEGTKLLFYPEVRVASSSVNNDIATAEVKAYSDTSNMATDGPVETLITAGFYVDLIKDVLIPGDHPTTGARLYKHKANIAGPAGEEGNLLTFTLTGKYLPGSELIAGTTKDFLITDRIFDDYAGNDPGAGLTSNAQLYTWDSTVLPCDSQGNGTITSCTQASAGDDIIIDLDGVDITDPNNTRQVFQVLLNVWVPQTDIKDQDTPLVFGNEIEWDYNSINPLLSVTGLSNFNGTGEYANQACTGALNSSCNNYIDYLLEFTSPGTWSVYKTFFGLAASGSNQKSYDIKYLAGQTVESEMMLSFAVPQTNNITGITCDNIDTSNFVFLGDSAGPLINLGSQSIHYPSATDLGWPLLVNNPSLVKLGIPNSRAKVDFFDAKVDFGVTIEYSNIPVSANASGTYSAQLRDSTCEDDMDGDTVYDWYPTAAAVPGGASAVTKVRMNFDLDPAEIIGTDPNWTSARVVYHMDLMIKPTTPTGTIIPNYMNAFNANPDVNEWLNNDSASIDPTSSSYANQIIWADTVEVVGAQVKVNKDIIDPVTGAQVNNLTINHQDTVTFLLEAETLGLAGTGETMSLTDTFRNTQYEYVAGSSICDLTGVTGTLTSCEPTVNIIGSYTTLVWDITGHTIGTKLPTITMQLKALSSYVSGISQNYLLVNSTTNLDIKNTFSARKRSGVSMNVITPEEFDVLKEVDQTLYEVRTPFDMHLSYGPNGTVFTEGDFIDIFPYNGDDTNLTSGNDSARPGSLYTDSSANTTVQLTALPVDGMPNGETYFWTDAPSASISLDPCHVDNQAAGYVPASGDYCFELFQRTGALIGGAAGTGAVVWTSVGTAPIDLDDVTAVRFSTTPFIATDPKRIVTLNFTPKDNIDGDFYCNSFGGRVPEISLNIISNDVCVEVVAGSIAGTVWFDADQSGGIHNPADGEQSFAGITVKLLDASGAPILDDQGNPITTITDINGDYIFENLPSGTYQTMVIPPVAPDGSPYTGTYDEDDGSNPGTFTTPDMSGPIVLEGPNSDPLLTDVDDVVDIDYGYYIEAAEIGDTVWFDADGDGEQDSTESGVAGVTVELYDINGNLVGTTVTDTNGNYIFEDLIPGDYKLTFIPPAGYLFTSQDSGSTDANDSDVDPTMGMTIYTTLDSGESDMTWDAGLILDPNAEIGDTVWFDTDRDGQQDPGENGVAGVTVELYDDQGNLVGTTTTDSNGNYIFTDLVPGDYKLTFIPPAGMTFTIQDAGSDTSDSDVDPIMGMTILTTLDSGESDMTWDAGLVTEMAGPGGGVIIGDTIFFDSDQDGSQNSGDFPIDGVTVNLYDSAGNLVGTTVTDVNGNYFFDVAPNTDYTIKLDNPSDYAAGGTLFELVNTITDASGNDANDSDSVLMGGFSAIMLTSPASGQDLTYDFGLIGQSANSHQGTIDSLMSKATSLALNAARTINKTCATKLNSSKLSGKLSKLYETVWSTVWMDIRMADEVACANTEEYSNKKYIKKIKKNLKKLKKTMKKINNSSCDASDKRVKRLRKKIRKFSKIIKQELKVIPESVQVCQ